MTAHGRTAGRPVPRDGAEPAAPDLSFTAVADGPARLSAVPAMVFRLGIRRTGGGPVRSVNLTCTIRIDPARRTYDTATSEALAELFGQPHRWATTLQPLTWTRLTTVVPPFRDETAVELQVPCPQDAELALAKYFHAVRDGDVPLDFLFGGTVFFDVGDGRLGAAQISQGASAGCTLHAGQWQGIAAGYDGGSPWLRLSREVHDLLGAHRTRNALGGWDETVRDLLRRGESGPEDSSARDPWPATTSESHNPAGSPWTP